MKGIILARGSESLLFPTTSCISKQILPIYDKPLIYYALYILMLSNIKQIEIILTPEDKNIHQQLLELLGDGSSIGIQLAYKVHEPFIGVADSILQEKNFIANDSVALILGDIMFFGDKMEIFLNSMDHTIQGAILFGYSSDSSSPEEFNPETLIPGIYFYNNSVIEIANNLKTSMEGGLEIMDINMVYNTRQQLKVIRLGKENKWFDTATHTSLLEIANYVSQTQKNTGYYIACIEEIAYKKGYITYEQLQLLAKPLMNTEYGKYIESIAKRQWEWES